MGLMQISVDVAWSPFGVDGRNYDALGLAAAADVLFVMAYDMQSQAGGPTHVALRTPPALHAHTALHALT